MGFGVILISHAWIRRLVPLFLGEMGKLPQILPKIDGALIRWLVIDERHNIWKRENIVSK